MSNAQSFRKRPILKAAAIVVAALTLVASGWAAEKVYQKIQKRPVVTKLESATTIPSMQPPGQKAQNTTVTITSMSGFWSPSCSDAPVEQGQTPAEMIAESDRQQREIEKLIPERKYEFVTTFEAQGVKQYVYRFKFSDGSCTARNFDVRLEDVHSWQDYQQKSEQLRQQRFKAIQEAIAHGRFRLLNVEPLLIHICRDKADGKQVSALLLRMPDGRETALIRPYPYPEVKVGQWEENYETSWQDHLKAVADGERELLGSQMVNSYTYEVTLADGTVTTWNYGGGEPLVPFKDPQLPQTTQPAARQAKP